MTTDTTTQLPPRYEAADVQKEVEQVWEAERCFHAEPDATKEPFCIVIPPPNVTARLHLGHAFNNTIQDILVRHARMQGKNAVWIPGTDHAGIATQTVVEKRLLQTEGKRRTDYDRDEFVAKVQAWKDEYEQVILGQLKAMGCSCDYERTCFTMDEQRSKAVREAFFRLFKDGLIYRGKRLVNWDPATQTALADDEVENEEIDGHFYYLKYPLVGSDETITVATTRPETMLGDTAVAINPKDPRAESLRGVKVLLPIVEREIPIVEDDYVVMPGDEDDPKAKFATGFLKVTPAHDPNDWDIGQRHDLEVINTMAPDASISDAHGWTAETDAAKQFVGLSREEARKQIVAWFKDNGLLEKVVPYRHSVGHSYRSHVPVEPYLSDQWYVAVQKPIPWMEDTGLVEGTDVPANSLAGLALMALEGTPASPERERGVLDKQQTPLAHARGSRGETLSYLITFTTYGTWLQGREPGSADRKGHNIPGEPYLVGDEAEERRQFARLKHAPTELHESQRTTTQNAIIGVCEHRGWTLHALHVRSNHLHAVVSADATPEKVMSDFKARATRSLREANLAGADQKVWTRHGSTRYLKSTASLDGAIRYTVDQQGRPLSPAPFREEPASPEHERGVSGNRSEPLAHARGSQGGSAVASLGDDVLTFVPERYSKTYRQWNAALRDWCISRQLWWGHRIPVWSEQVGVPTQSVPAIFNSLDAQSKMSGNGATEQCAFAIQELSSGGEARKALSFDARYQASDAWREEAAFMMKSGFSQDPDVLDTWFSSALWPMSTLGWPERTTALEIWNPTSVLCTAREIITLWVSRMVMFNRYMLAHPDEQSRKTNASPERERGVSDDQAEPLAHARGSQSDDSRNLPFHNVFIHAMIQDGHGQKMSKSLGNGVDPLDIIDSHGADAMRFTLAGMATHTQDVRLPVDAVDPHTGETFEAQTFKNAAGYVVAKPIQEHKGNRSVSGYGLATGEATPSDDVPLARNTSSKFDLGRNFCNKLWNASRFVIGNLQDAGAEAPGSGATTDAAPTSEPGASAPASTGPLQVTDRWILSRLSQTVAACDGALSDYRFDRYTTACYDFFWRDFCDWYVESTKPRTKANDAVAKQVLAVCLDWSLRLMHPIVPFATERLWWSLNEAAAERGVGDYACPASERCITAAWPSDVPAADKQAIADVDRLRELVLAVRQLRADHKVEPKRVVPVHLKGITLDDARQAFETWANAELVDAESAASAAASAKVGDVDILVGGIIDEAADAARNEKERAALEKQVKSLKGRLANKGYTDKAPPHLVQETRDQLAAAEKQLAEL
ncbi:MAG: class I tRNA ligase family protein [Planctomycetota bacterium]